MTSATHPEFWAVFPVYCFYYFIIMGALHAVVFLIGCMALSVLPQNKPGRLLRRIGQFGLFVLLLLIVGMLSDGLWNCLIRDRLYYSNSDSIDFTPFWPITWRVINNRDGSEPGRLFGVTLPELQLIWLVFALGTWAITILLYRRLRRSLARMQYRVGIVCGVLGVILTGSSLLATALAFVPADVTPNPYAWSSTGVWLGLVLVALALPAFIMWRIVRDEKRRSRLMRFDHTPQFPSSW